MQSQKKSVKINNKNRNGKRFILYRQPSNPPRVQGKIRTTFTFRYKQLVTGLDNITFKDLMLMLSIYSTTTATVSALTAFKIVRICIWATGGGTSNQTTIRLEAQNTGNTGVGAMPIELADTGYAPNRYAQICYIPNKMSVHGQWINVTSTTTTSADSAIFQIDSNQGDTMDITLKIFLNDGDSQLVGTTYPAGTTGAFLYANLPNSSLHWEPNF